MAILGNRHAFAVSNCASRAIDPHQLAGQTFTEATHRRNRTAGADFDDHEALKYGAANAS